MSDDYVAALFLTIDGEHCARIMQRGTREDCEFVRDNIPAVAHSDPEVVTDTRLVVMPHEAFMQLVEEAVQ